MISLSVLTAYIVNPNTNAQVIPEASNTVPGGANAQAKEIITDSANVKTNNNI